MRSSGARSTARSPSSHKHSSTSAVTSPSEGCSQSSSSSPSLMTFVRLRCSPNTPVLTLLSRHDCRLTGPCSRPRRRAQLEQGLSRRHTSADTGRAHHLDQRPRCSSRTLPRRRRWDGQVVHSPFHSKILPRAASSRLPVLFRSLVPGGSSSRERPQHHRT